MRKDADLEYREEPELDSRKMVYLMGLMLFLLVIPFMLYVTGVIEVWLMSVLFIPGICILLFMIYKYRIRR